MKISYQEWIKRLNLRLTEANQQIRVLEVDKHGIQLSDGRFLTGNQAVRFKKRTMNKSTNLWVSNMDALLAGTVSEKQIRSRLASLGGVSCQCQHGARIRENLNTGIPWNAGTRGRYPHKFGPMPDSVREKIAKKNSGPGNGMYGKRMSAEDRAYRSQLMQTKILNGEFTPRSNNRRTRWDSELDGIRYRSSWEALYKYINPSAEYEKLRLIYSVDNVQKIYIVDFVDHLNQIVTEVKPRELCSGAAFCAKIQALHEWAHSKNYRVLLVDREWLLHNRIEIDYQRFNDIAAQKIKALYETDTQN
jgi:hypothetical protein